MENEHSNSSPINVFRDFPALATVCAFTLPIGNLAVDGRPFPQSIFAEN